MKIVGLTGLAGHGKTSVAQELVKRGYTRVAFADKVKMIAAATYGIEPMVFYGSNPEVCKNTTIVEPYNKTLRQMMTETGDCYKAFYGDNVWVDLLAHQLNTKNYALIVIEDIRYDYEADAVRSWGGEVFHVDASERLSSDAELYKHSSEQGVTRLDGEVVIDNNDSVEKLLEQLNQLFGELTND